MCQAPTKLVQSKQDALRHATSATQSTHNRPHQKGTAPTEAPSGNMQADPHGGLNATAGTAPHWIYNLEVVTCSGVGS